MFDFNAALKKKKIERDIPSSADINFPTSVRESIYQAKISSLRLFLERIRDVIAYASFAYNRIAAINIDKYR